MKNKYYFLFVTIPYFTCCIMFAIIKQKIKKKKNKKNEKNKTKQNNNNKKKANDQAEMCRFLIKNKCEVNAIDRLGRTPLMDAAEVGKFKTKTNKQTNKQANTWTCKKKKKNQKIGSIEVIRVLIEAGAQINATDKEGYAAISYCVDLVSASEPKFMEACEELIKHNANPNFKGKFYRRTILHCAAAQGKEELVRKLVESHNAEVDVVDSEGKTPIFYANEQNHTTIVQFLENARRNNGWVFFISFFAFVLLSRTKPQ